MELATAFCQNSQNILKKLFACLPDQFDNQSLWCVIADSKALLFHNTFSALEALSSIVADNIIHFYVIFQRPGPSCSKLTMSLANIFIIV